MTGEESRRSARRQAVFVLYQHDLTGIAVDQLVDAAVRERGSELDAFTHEVVAAVLATRDEIDALIDAASAGWSVERIAPLERNILRVAVHEIVGRDDVPDAVAIDEAVGLAKRYCQADAAGFVNGILGAVVRREVTR